MPLHRGSGFQSEALRTGAHSGSPLTLRDIARWLRNALAGTGPEGRTRR